MRRIFPVAAIALVAVGLVVALLVRPGTPSAVAVADTPVRATTSNSVPVLLGGTVRAEDQPSEPLASASDSGAVAPSGSPVAETAPPTAVPTAAPATSATAAPTPDPSASPLPKPKKPKKPKAATKTRKARNVPDRPLDKHTGKRIVYDKKLMTVWLMNKKDEVVARYPVVGRWDRPAKGTYRIFSKSPMAWNPNSQVTFANMVRFTYGPDTKSPIGFHAIPRYSDGSRMHPVSALGLPIATGGCIRMSDKAAKEVYDFMKVGDLVVVLPSP